mmetsp:Transcript_85125/g.274075  ORF Transcript_85125/g.274075 Transcript_85125/m.274075 type:complete len:443 (+) Transcript_85125:174-1502(+)
MLEEELSIGETDSSVLGASGEGTRLHFFPVWEWDDAAVAAEADVFGSPFVLGGGPHSHWPLFRIGSPLPQDASGAGSAAGSVDSVEVELARILSDTNAPFPVVGAQPPLELASLLAEELLIGSDSATLLPVRSGSPSVWWPSPRRQSARAFGGSAAAVATPPTVALGLPPRTPSRNSVISEPYASTVLTSLGSVYGTNWAVADFEAERAVAETFAAVAATSGYGGSDGMSIPGSPDSPDAAASMAFAGASGSGPSVATFGGAGSAAAAAVAALAPGVLAPVVAASMARVQPALPPPWRSVGIDVASMAMSEESNNTASVLALNETDIQSSRPEFDDSLRIDLGDLFSLGRSGPPQLSSDEAQGLPKVRFEAPERQSCSICLEVFRKGMLLTGLTCGHVFHVDCLSQWVQRCAHCPNCRARVEPCAARAPEHQRQAGPSLHPR